jgi:hypothetical protein
MAHFIDEHFIDGLRASDKLWRQLTGQPMSSTWRVWERHLRHSQASSLDELLEEVKQADGVQGLLSALYVYRGRVTAVSAVCAPPSVRHTMM